MLNDSRNEHVWTLNWTLPATTELVQDEPASDEPAIFTHVYLELIPTCLIADEL